jgi:hypothetical protein
MAETNRTHQATLGCGTLILIAVIVMFFSRPEMNKFEHQIKELRTEIGELKKMIEAQAVPKVKMHQEKNKE